MYMHRLKLFDALTATSVQVETLDGRQLLVPIQEIITPRTCRRIIGEGMPELIEN